MSRLVVLHQGAIGDFLLSLSVVQAVREGLRCSHVTAIASAASARLAAGRSAVDVWRCPDAVGLHRLFCSDLPLSDHLAETLADAEFVLNLLGGATESVHHRLKQIVRGELVSVDPRPTLQTRQARQHITLQWSHDIRRAGWSVGEPGPVRLSVGNGRVAQTSRVLIHPGSGGRAKCWPLDRFIALADALSVLDVTWMLGPAEVEQARRLRDRDEPLLIEDDLCRAAEQMAGFDVYVGNDSGITHLAAALGLRTVAIFGTTDPCIWRPLGDHVEVVAPHSRHELQNDLARGMGIISVEQVLEVVQRVSNSAM